MDAIAEENGKWEKHKNTKQKRSEQKKENSKNNKKEKMGGEGTEEN